MLLLYILYLSNLHMWYYPLFLNSFATEWTLVIKTRFTSEITMNLLHNKKQKLSHIFNVELGESSKAFGNLRIQWQSNAA